jgi:glycosyltransferase involved in cell wall biosynthesis
MEPAHSTQRLHGIAFLGNYLPRACGIATFTYDLAEAVAQQAGSAQPVIVTAMNDRPDGYAYPERVKFEIRQDNQVDYARAADFLNFSRIDVISLQHEYGIFGGEAGSNLLTLIRDLHRPLVVTCHTLYEDPEQMQREVFTEIAARATKLVVLSKKAVEIVENVYGVRRDKVVMIPHGIHDVPFIDPSFYKDKFGVEGRQMLLTFGLLHRTKGIEHMIDALPAIIERHPKTTYLVLGATHPTVVRDEGEVYRLSLQRRVRDLGLENHVLFHPRFVDLDELLEYIGASDICVTPYLNLDQISSGALCYAMGSGKALVSTPFWYAEELLAMGRGHLVPVGDSKALEKAVIGLLDDDVAMSAVRKKAYAYCRNMIWPAVARDYLRLFDEVRSHVPKSMPTAASTRRSIAATNLPLPKLTHLVRLSDETGPARHARHAVPDWRHGYGMDDASAMIVVSAKYNEMFGDEEAAKLAETCLALLQVLISDGRDIAAGLDYTRTRRGSASEVSISKAFWALGYLVSRGPALLAPASIDMFQQLLPIMHPTEPRAIGHAILGAANYLTRFPGASDVRRCLTFNTDALAVFCAKPGWIDRWTAPDWPVAVQALTIGGAALNSPELLRRGLSLLDDILEATSGGGVFLKRGENPDEEELPTTAASFIEALGALFFQERDAELLIPIRNAADWFLGQNRKGESLYEFSTGGCHDALTASGLNRNQGTEATTFWLLALTTLHRLAGMEASAQTFD